MSIKLSVLMLITFCTGCSTLTPEQLEFNQINSIKDHEIAIQRFGELAQESIDRSNKLLEIAARSTNNRIYLLNAQERYTESIEVAEEAIARFEQYNDPYIRSVVVGLLLNQSSSFKNLGQTEASLQLLERATAEYQDDDFSTTQILIATALLGQVDAYMLAENETQAQEIFEVFDERYMQSDLYQSFNPKAVSTTCEDSDPCPPYSTGEHWLSPKFFEDRAAWYRQQFDSKEATTVTPYDVNNDTEQNK